MGVKRAHPAAVSASEDHCWGSQRQPEPVKGWGLSDLHKDWTVKPVSF